MFRLGRQKIPRNEGKRVYSLFFLGPSSPWPTFGSPGPPNNFMAKGLARLGELIASGLSFSSPGRAATAPRWPFTYKQASQGYFKGLQGSKVDGIVRIKKEEEKRGNKVEALPNRNRDHSLRRFLILCSLCDHRLVLFLGIEFDLCTLRGPPCYYVHIHLLHLSSTISSVFVKFNFNRSLVL